jgi:hypothetical protein
VIPRLRCTEVHVYAHQLQVPQPKLLISIGPALTRPTFVLLAIRPNANDDPQQPQSIVTRRIANIVERWWWWWGSKGGVYPSLGLSAFIFSSRGRGRRCGWVSVSLPLNELKC